MTLFYVNSFSICHCETLSGVEAISF